jgi:hypothetical protein
MLPCQHLTPVLPLRKDGNSFMPDPVYPPMPVWRCTYLAWPEADGGKWTHADKSTFSIDKPGQESFDAR